MHVALHIDGSSSHYLYDRSRSTDGGGVLVSERLL
jgi:hypothetical protein